MRKKVNSQKFILVILIFAKASQHTVRTALYTIQLSLLKSYIMLNFATLLITVDYLKVAKIKVQLYAVN